MQIYIISILAPFGWFEVFRTPSRVEMLQALKKYREQGHKASYIIKSY